jgi:D-alanine transaminase
LPRIAYVNGRYLPARDAAVSIEDRGYQFSDGIYEVCEVRGGAIIDERRHLERLRRSLGELRIRMPVAPGALAVIMRETIRRNRVRDGIVYVQMTRGVARRDFAFPPPGTAPSLVVTARSLDSAGNETKAWFVDREGRVTEGASSNAWIVTRDGRVVTRPADNGILRGITRTVLIGVVKAQNLVFDERPFTVEEAYGAQEAFVTAASQIVMPVVRIDDRTIGDGEPGPVARALRESFHRHAEWS